MRVRSHRDSASIGLDVVPESCALSSVRVDRCPAPCDVRIGFVVLSRVSSERQDDPQADHRRCGPIRLHGHARVGPRQDPPRARDDDAAEPRRRRAAVAAGARAGSLPDQRKLARFIGRGLASGAGPVWRREPLHHAAGRGRHPDWRDGRVHVHQRVRAEGVDLAREDHRGWRPAGGGLLTSQSRTDCARVRRRRAVPAAENGCGLLVRLWRQPRASAGARLPA